MTVRSPETGADGRVKTTGALVTASAITPSVSLRTAKRMFSEAKASVVPAAIAAA